MIENNIVTTKIKLRREIMKGIIVMEKENSITTLETILMSETTLTNLV
jgi:hypothetical protein